MAGGESGVLEMEREQSGDDSLHSKKSKRKGKGEGEGKGKGKGKAAMTRRTPKKAKENAKAKRAGWAGRQGSWTASRWRTQKDEKREAAESAANQGCGLEEEAKKRRVARRAWDELE